MENTQWESWVEEAVSRLQTPKMFRSLRPIELSSHAEDEILKTEEYDQVFDKMHPWDRSVVEVAISETTFRGWLHDIPCPHGDDTTHGDGLPYDIDGGHLNHFKKLLLFAGNDYLGLGAHPTVRKAAAKAAQEHGMGPRGSALVCGYTFYHNLLESCLADLKKKEDCLLCPTGYAANMALMGAIGKVGPLLAVAGKPSEDEKVAIFSDALNHASIIDGINHSERQRTVVAYIYRHNDMSHLNLLLSNCAQNKKVVVTDGIFSMDGDFAPMDELVKLRRRHRFLLVIDDAHGTFVCGKNGGGVAEKFNCEKDVDVCIGTLSKAAGCLGGFIACSNRWKQLILSTGRAFIFSTASPVPIAAAAHAAVAVAKKESWRRRALWDRVREFQALTGIPVSCPIISLIVGSEEKALQAHRHLFISGFHVGVMVPPAVPPNSCRLRVTLTAAHTSEDLKKLTTALSQCINFKDIGVRKTNGHAKL